MTESWDTARMIQRVIDDRYPNARLLWQAFQAQAQAARPIASQGGPPATQTGGGSRSYNARSLDDNHDQIDKMVQRVIDNRYPETRAIWMASREEPVYGATGQRSRTGGALGPMTRNLPYLNRTDDPRRPGLTATRPQTVSFA
jgi:hypothetical protein